MSNLPQHLAEKNNSLTNRFLDFWLLGGLSILIYIFLYIFENTSLKQQPQVARHVSNIGPTFTMLTLFINFPHFIWSYKLAYTQPFSFIKRNWFQLILVPFLMLIMFYFAFIYWHLPPQKMAVSKVIAATSGLFGSNERTSIYPSFGNQVIGLLLVFQFGIVGWHYVKQTYGTMMTYSHYSNYTFLTWQRNLLRWTLFGIWWTFFIKANVGQQSYTSLGMEYYSLDLPLYLTSLSQIYVTVTLILSLALVFLRNWLVNKQLPCMSLVAPFISMYLWFTPWDFLFIPLFFTLVVPCAHSLQYLCFVYKVEKESSISKNPQAVFRDKAFLILWIVIIGFFLIEVLPPLLDFEIKERNLLTVGFFAAAFQIFINIHHYFIDNAIWQKRNKEIKGYLFK